MGKVHWFNSQVGLFVAVADDIWLQRRLQAARIASVGRLLSARRTMRRRLQPANIPSSRTCLCARMPMIWNLPFFSNFLPVLLGPQRGLHMQEFFMNLQLIKQSFRFHKCCSCVYYSRYYSITTDLVVAMYYLVSSVRMTLESSPPARVLCVWFVRLLSHVKILTQLSRLSPS